MTTNAQLLTAARTAFPNELPTVPQLISALHVGYFRARGILMEMEKAMFPLLELKARTCEPPPANEDGTGIVLNGSEGMTAEAGFRNALAVGLFSPEG